MSRVIQEVQLGHAAPSRSAGPEALRGDTARSPSLAAARASEHLRLSELRDTGSAAHGADRGSAALRGAADRLGAARGASACRASRPDSSASRTTMPRGAWDVNLQLLLKLIGTSLATGLERIRIEARLAKLEERTDADRRRPPTTACGTSTSRATRCTSRRAGRRCSATATRTCAARRTGAAWCIRMTSSRVQDADSRSRRRQDCRSSKARTACATATANGAG